MLPTNEPADTPPLEQRGMGAFIDHNSLLESQPSDRSSIVSGEEFELTVSNEQPASHGRQPMRREASIASSGLYPAPSKTVLAFADGDPENPYNWSSTRKIWIVIIGILTVINSTMSSSLPAGGIASLAEHFGITNEEQRVLPNSIFIAGYVVAPLIFSPLSEEYGRWIVIIGTFAGYSIFTLATCFANNFTAYCFCRLLSGIFASSPISVVGGVYADLYSNPVARGRALAIFMGGTLAGPACGPIVSGYLGEYGWRWPYWFLLIMAGVTWIPLFFWPETYGPQILKTRARRIRKETNSSNIYAPAELQKRSVRDILVKVLFRPIRMFICEAIVLFSCLFLCFLYGIFYLFFQAFPAIYPPIYGFSAGQTGLTFLAIGIGAMFGVSISLWWDVHIARASARGKTWTTSEEYRRLPLGCIAGPFFVTGLFWIGWTARPSVHWIVPIIGGIPVGIGFNLMFISLTNYMVDASSALAASSFSRSIFGVCLPFAGRPMFQSLGVAWAMSTLALLSLVMSVVPYVFIKYGTKLRENSQFCIELREQKRLDQEAADQRRRREEHWQRRLEREAARDAAHANSQESEKDVEKQEGA